MGKSVESIPRCCLRLLSIAFYDKYACGLPIENGVPLLSFSVSRYRYLCPVPPAIADEQHMTNNKSSIIVALFFIWFYHYQLQR